MIMIVCINYKIQCQVIQTLILILFLMLIKTHHHHLVSLGNLCSHPNLLICPNLHQNLLHKSPESSLTYFRRFVMKILIAIVNGILIMMIAMALVMLLTITVGSLSTTTRIPMIVILLLLLTLSLISHVLNLLLQREIHNVLRINQQIHHFLPLPLTKPIIVFII